jgi:hydrogenase maturation factor
MSKSKEEVRARLKAKADQIIEEYMEWESSHPRPDLMQIEEIALKLRKEFGREMAQMAVEEQNERTPAPGPNCPKCGREMHYKGKKETQVESRAGALKIERGYYYCPECKESIFPPG